MMDALPKGRASFVYYPLYPIGFNRTGGYGGGQDGFAVLDVPHRGEGGMVCCLATHQMAYIGRG